MLKEDVPVSDNLLLWNLLLYHYNTNIYFIYLYLEGVLLCNMIIFNVFFKNAQYTAHFAGMHLHAMSVPKVIGQMRRRNVNVCFISLIIITYTLVNDLECIWTMACLSLLPKVLSFPTNTIWLQLWWIS